MTDVFRDFGWPEQRVLVSPEYIRWISSSYFEYKEYLKKQEALKSTRIFETLRGYHGLDLVAKLRNADNWMSKYLMHLIHRTRGKKSGRDYTNH